MAIVQLTRYKALGEISSVMETLKKAKLIVEKHGAEYYRVSRLHSGQNAGQWMVAQRYASWEDFGKAQDALARDPDWAGVLRQASVLSELMGRTIAVSVDL